MEYRAKVRRAPHGFDAWTPDLPGCAARGATETDALENLRHAIEGRLDLEALAAEGNDFDRTVVAELPEVGLRRAEQLAAQPVGSASPYPSYLSFIVGSGLFAMGLTGVFGFILVEPHTSPIVFFASAIVAGLGGGGILMGLLTREPPPTTSL